MNFLRSTEPRIDNQWSVKIIGDKIKLVRMYSVCESGWESSEEKQERINDTKLRKNIMRARNTIFEYAYCNSWDWFFTGTLNSQKVARDDLGEFEKRFSQMVRDLRKKYLCDIQYLIVPELHSDLENWHCHGLLQGIPFNRLSHFKDEMYNWSDYERVFGFCSLDKIRSHEAVSKYLTKYVTKCYYSNRGVSEVGKHLYCVSRGLKKGEILYKGQVKTDCLLSPSYENDFCQVFDLDLNDENLEICKNLFGIDIMN